MSDDLKLLGPPKGDSSSGTGADAPPPQSAADFIRSQRAVPKRVYEEAKTAPSPEPEPAPEPTKEEPKGSKPDDQDYDAKGAAEEFVDGFVTLQAFGLSLYSGEAMEKFAFPQQMRDRAVHHMARGLAKMGNVEMPWMWGLAMALVPPSIFNWMQAKAAAEAKAQKVDADEGNPHAEAYTPPPTPRTERPRSATLHDQDGRPMRTVPQQPTTCQAPGCTNLTKRGRKYCGQSCSGRASKGRKIKRNDEQRS